jgi:VCBS repeat-containing protein
VNRLLFAAAALILVTFIGAFLHSGDAGSIAGDNLEFTLDYNSTSTVEETILRDLASRPSLVSQRAFVTIPVLSTEAPVRKLSELVGRNLKSFFPKFSLNSEHLPSQTQHKSRMAAFGGLTVYEANIYGYSADETRTFTDQLKAIYSTTIRIHLRQAGGIQQDFSVVIRPIISLDCDFSPHRLRYCRNVREKFTGLRLPSEELHNRVAAELVKMGVDTPLAPDVDLRRGTGPAESSAMTDAARTIAGTLSAHRLIPVAKHFMYDGSADPHEQVVHVGTPLDQYPLWLAPYAALEESGLPYFLMVSHHTLLLDPGVPSPLSLKVKNLIRAQFPNAVIMADDIRMRALGEDGIPSTIERLKTDVFLFHAGNIMPDLAPVIEGLTKARGQESEESLYRLLNLKWKMGLLTIAPLHATAAEEDGGADAASGDRG